MVNQRIWIIKDKAIRHNATKAVSELTGDPVMEVIVREWKEDKSAEQRGWFHVLCKLMSDETGYTQGEIKELIKKTILGTTLVTIGQQTKEVTASSEAQDKIGYSELIEGLYRIGAEAGVQLPAPRYTER